MNEVEQESQDSAEENNIDSVSIIQFISIKNCSVKTSAGSNNIMVPYKVDTGGNCNIMPLHIYKTLFPEITNEQLVAN